LSKYVIHSVSFGSEPLFSWSISGTFVAELQKIKGELKTLDIPLTVSEVSHLFFIFSYQWIIGIFLNYGKIDEIWL
jgi:hypothetical protein